MGDLAAYGLDFDAIQEATGFVPLDGWFDVAITQTGVVNGNLQLQYQIATGPHQGLTLKDSCTLSHPAGQGILKAICIACGFTKIPADSNMLVGKRLRVLSTPGTFEGSDGSQIPFNKIKRRGARPAANHQQQAPHTKQQQPKMEDDVPF